MKLYGYTVAKLMIYDENTPWYYDFSLFLIYHWWSGLVDNEYVWIEYV